MREAGGGEVLDDPAGAVALAAGHAVPTLIGPDHRLQAGAAPPASTQQVIELTAELDAAGVTWTNIPPLGAGPRSLAGTWNTWNGRRPRSSRPFVDATCIT